MKTVVIEMKMVVIEMKRVDIEMKRVDIEVMEVEEEEGEEAGEGTEVVEVGVAMAVTETITMSHFHPLLSERPPAADHTLYVLHKPVM